MQSIYTVPFQEIQTDSNVHKTRRDSEQAKDGSSSVRDFCRDRVHKECDQANFQSHYANDISQVADHRYPHTHRPMLKKTIPSESGFGLKLSEITGEDWNPVPLEKAWTVMKFYNVT